MQTSLIACEDVHAGTHTHEVFCSDIGLGLYQQGHRDSTAGSGLRVKVRVSVRVLVLGLRVKGQD